MSRGLVVWILAALVAAGVLMRHALADSTALQTMLDGQLVPSAAPALLAPITGAGRVGWNCRPERAAAASGWHDADLPSSH